MSAYGPSSEKSWGGELNKCNRNFAKIESVVDLNARVGE